MGEEFIQKCLMLLVYALKRRGITEKSFLIGVDGDEGKVDQKTCLIRREKQWDVFFIERGVVKDRAIHESLEEACKHFYWRLTGPEEPWDFTAEWESETGLQI